MYGYKEPKASQRCQSSRFALQSDEKTELHGKLIQRISHRNDTGLPNKLKSGIETLSGYSLDAVRVHYNSSKPAQLQALAYAQGTEIYVAPGQEKHLPHEAWHVVQQMQGRVKPTLQMNGVRINYNSALEHEASVLGERANHISAASAEPGVVQAISESCVQCRLTGDQLNKVKRHERYIYIQAHTDNYCNPITNYSLIKSLIDLALPGENRGTYSNIAQVARGLDLAIIPEDTVEIERVDRSRFSSIPDTCSESQLRNIFYAPNQSPMKVRTTENKKPFWVYHIQGIYPEQGKPIWTIREDKKINIIGMYEHRGEDYTKYHKRDGDGPNLLIIV